MDKFYPKAPETPKTETALDYATEAPAVIALMESGCPSDYKVDGMNAGDPLPKAHICGIVLAGRNSPESMSAVYDRVIAERDALEAKTAVIDTDTTQTAYISELTKACAVVDTAKWLTGMKLRYCGSSGATWTALRTAVVATKPVAEVEEPIVEEKP